MAENTAYKSFQDAFKKVTTEIANREKEEDKRVSVKPMTAKFTKDFMDKNGNVLIEKGTEQVMSEITFLTYQDLGLVKKVGR